MLMRLLGWLWKIPETQAASRAQGETGHEVDGQKLVTDYLSNSVAADSKYRGKVIRTAGSVHAVREELGTLVLYLDVDASLIRCECQKWERPRLEKMAAGESIWIKGVVSGPHVGNIVLTGCSLVSTNETETL